MLARPAGRMGTRLEMLVLNLSPSFRCVRVCYCCGGCYCCCCYSSSSCRQLLVVVVVVAAAAVVATAAAVVVRSEAPIGAARDVRRSFVGGRNEHRRQHNRSMKSIEPWRRRRSSARSNSFAATPCSLILLDRRAELMLLQPLCGRASLLSSPLKADRDGPLPALVLFVRKCDGAVGSQPARRRHKKSQRLEELDQGGGQEK
jgi:hypothetical protein